MCLRSLAALIGGGMFWMAYAPYPKHTTSRFWSKRAPGAQPIRLRRACQALRLRTRQCSLAAPTFIIIYLLPLALVLLFPRY